MFQWCKTLIMGNCPRYTCAQGEEVEMEGVGLIVEVEVEVEEVVVWNIGYGIFTFILTPILRNTQVLRVR